MKKLSDYKGEDTIEVIANLYEPFSKILANDEVKEAFQGGGSMIKVAVETLKRCKKEVSEILLIIDPTPINGVNVFFRFLGFLNDLAEDEMFSDFFTSAGQGKTTAFGGLTESIEEDKQ